MWGAIIGAIAGGVAGGITSKLSTDAKVKAYKDAAGQIKTAMDKYSGEAAYRNLMNQGETTANALNMGSKMREASQGLTPYEFNPNDMTSAGMETGQDYASSLNKGKYDRDTAYAQNIAKQGEVQSGVINQASQGISNTVGGLADLTKNVGVTDGK